jgi:hypothetical protein
VLTTGQRPDGGSCASVAPKLGTSRHAQTRARDLAWRVLRRWAGVVLCGWTLLFVVGCAGKDSQTAEQEANKAAGMRMRVALLAAQQQDTSKIPELLDLLEDEHPMVRFHADAALTKLTGLRLGYNYAAPAKERERMARAWRSYFEKRDATEESQEGAQDLRGESSTSFAPQEASS